MVDKLPTYFDIREIDRKYVLMSDIRIKKGFMGNSDVVVVSPDLGSVTRTRKLAERLHAPMAIIDKRRPKANVSEIMNIIGDIKGKTCILIDDMIDTAGTISNAANALMDLGAVEVYAACTHGVFSGDAIKKIDNSSLKKVYITDSIYLTEEKRSDKIEILSADTLFAETLKRIINNQSLMSLLEK